LEAIVCDKISKIFSTLSGHTYICDRLPLASIVEKYINYDKLQLGGNPKNRLYIRVFIVEKYPKKD
jgi:hypothetical protein